MLIPTKARHLLFMIACIVIFLLSACNFDSTTTPAAHIESARIFLAKNELSASTIELKNALQIDSNLAEARWLLGEINLRLGYGDAAFKEFTDARTLGFDNPELDTALLRAMLLQGKFEDILDKTQSEDTMTVDTLVLRGNAYLGLQQQQDAKHSFNKALSLDNSSVEAKLGLANVALSGNDLDKAGEIIEETLILAPEDFEVWLLKGQLALLQDLPAVAESAFAKAVSIADYKIVAQFQLARALLIQGKTKEAFVPIKAVEKTFPGHPLARYFRGFIALTQKDTSLAKEFLQQVLKVAPTHAETLLLLSQINYEEKHLEQAKEYITTFLAAHPDHVPALKLLSVITLGLHQSDEAIKALNSAAANSSDDGQVLALLGSAQIENGNLSRGVELLEEAVLTDPGSAALLTELAIGHLKVGKTGQAITELESAIELEPELVRADVMLVLTYINSKRFDDAMKAAELLIDKQPNDPLPHNLLGLAYFGAGNTQSARQQYEKSIAIDPLFTAAMANLADVDLQDGEIIAAEKRLLNILSIDKHNIRALINLGQIEASRGNYDKMLSLFEQARLENPSVLLPRLLLAKHYLRVGKNKKLLEVISEASALAPEDTDVLLLMGQAQRLNDNPEGSLNTLSTLVKLAPDSHDAMFQLSLTQFRAGNTVAARETLQAILKIDPTHVGALHAFARLALADKDFNLARDFMARIKQIDNNDANSSTLEGDILLAEDKTDDAITSYKNIYRTYKTSDVVTKLAVAYLEGNKDSEAISLIETWLKDNPDDVRVESLLAGIYQKNKDDKQAMIIFNRILEKNPDSVLVLNNLAWLNIDTNLALAHEMARKAYIQLPDRPEIADTLGWILIKQNKVEEGLAHIRTALAAAPDSPDIRYHLATGLILAGESQRALSELTRILEDHKSFPSRKEAEALYNSLK